MAEAELNLAKERPQAVRELQALLEKVVMAMTQDAGAMPEKITLVEKDKPILLAAISVKATHLLTGDKLHFGHLFGTSVEGVLILPLAAYLNKETLPNLKWQEPI